MKIFLFIRGMPGAGKISTARELESRLGWRIFWQHSIRDAIVDIVGDHFISELADEVMKPIIHFLLKQKDNVIFVRSDIDGKMAKYIAKFLKKINGYKLCFVSLTAEKDILLKRCLARSDHHRIPSKERFDKYLRSKPPLKRLYRDELVIDTTKIPVSQVADKICKHFKLK